jgi:hypothetical protein
MFRPSYESDARLVSWAAEKTSPADLQDGHKRLVRAHLKALVELTGEEHTAWFAEAMADIFDTRAYRREAIATFRRWQASLLDAPGPDDRSPTARRQKALAGR